MVNRIHVMFIDDDQFVRYIIEHSLRNEFDLTICEDALKALESLEKYQPDIIVTDLRMPLLGGKDFIERIRSSSKYKYVPIIVLSSTDDSSLRIECLEVGADDFIVKPFNPNELRVRIKSQLRRFN